MTKFILVCLLQIQLALWSQRFRIVESTSRGSKVFRKKKKIPEKFQKVKHSIYIVLTTIYLVLLLLSSQSCPTICDPMDYSPPDSSVHGISQERILEWVAISCSRGSSWPRGKTCVFCNGRQILYHWATKKDYPVLGIINNIEII